jgi:baculoviral IAP repeat-containing protein 6
MLLTALGQKSLSGTASQSILESLLSLLAKLLSPLMARENQMQQQGCGQLDLLLIGWLLLFLSKCLDQAFPSTASEEDKQQGKESTSSSSSTSGSSPSNRWDFIQGDTTLQSSKVPGKATSARLYRRKLHKKLLHHKQHLINLQQAKKNFMASQVDKVGLSKDAELLIKQHELMFKQHLKQYSNKVTTKTHYSGQVYGGLVSVFCSMK